MKNLQITLTSSREGLFVKTDNFQDANIALKAILRRKKYSDVYYHIQDNNVDQIGSIDLEPESFHKPHQNRILSNHLLTFWTNISKMDKPKPGFTKSDIQYFTRLLNYLKPLLIN
jgi:hypothetical protein